MTSSSGSHPKAVKETWKLKKCVYDLLDDCLYWYDRVKEIVLTTGGQLSQVDTAVFYWLDQDCAVTRALACHVDDFIWGANKVFT